jgi:aspartate carbamoyltransferase catalytic subunit
MSFRSLVSVAEFDPAFLDEVQRRVDMLAEKGPSGDELRGSKLAGLFLEPSTRTKVSFELAIKMLGGIFVSVDPGRSSLEKDETIKDTLFVVASMGFDAIVIRAPWSGFALQAKSWSALPIVNAGDGQREHPTQALGDALAVASRVGARLGLSRPFDGLRMAIVGDIKHSRVARSVATLFSSLGASIVIAGPEGFLIDPRSLAKGVSVVGDLDSALGDVDLVYMLRVQTERLMEGERFDLESYRREYQLDARRLSRLKADALIMHPGPTNWGVELAEEVAADPRFVALKQVRYCSLGRMALLEILQGGC